MRWNMLGLGLEAYQGQKYAHSSSSSSSSLTVADIQCCLASAGLC